jgi:hypothetical protein
VPGVLQRRDDRRHEVSERADRAGQDEAERDQEPKGDAGTPDVMVPHGGALSSHLRLYNELG